MKIRALAILLMLSSIVLFHGCGEPPTADLQAAEQALQRARTAGAEKFASSELNTAQSAYAAAKKEVDTESEKLFKNFEKSNQLIADAKTKAQGAESAAQGAKSRAKSGAESVISVAATAVSSAKANLDMAPTGKGMEGDVDQLRADLGAAEADLSAARRAVSSEDFDGAKSKANSATQKASQVDSGVAMAQDEYARRAEEARPWYEKI